MRLLVTFLAAAGAVQPEVPWIDRHALKAAEEHEAVAQVAAESSKASHEALLSAQAALSARDAARQSRDFLSAQVDPREAIQKELDQARDWAQEARAYASHAEQTFAEMRKLPQQAVENVTKLVEEEVRREAYMAAERRAAEPTPSPEAVRVAAKTKAEEPYRQAVERAQQNVALSLAKSQRAAEAVDRLAEESQAVMSRLYLSGVEQGDPTSWTPRKT
ncbi:unnamed protein product [Durusdinium trenchii]|uniref:DUF4398 domain-containing protein n=1 Tax=Durusdinium trenchii TaxID=1381693 RepID=A0ABP0QGX4_9DINO